MSDKPPSGKKKTGKKSKKKSENSSPRTPKSRKSSEPSSPRPDLDPVPKLLLSSKVCQLHKKDLRLYADAREELLCEDCAAMPNYGRYPSKIISVDEAFRVRLSGLYNVLNNYVLPKKAQLLRQKTLVEFSLNSVKMHKIEIEKDMKAEFSAMNERLNFSYGTKQAVLQHDLKELQVDLDRILHIINIVESSANDQVSFLQRSGDLRSLLDLAHSKPFRVNIDVEAHDLPKELTKVREIAEDFEAVKNLIKIKDELIWKLLHEKPSAKDMKDATQRELAEWARLAEKYTQELKKFQVNCEYCGCPLNEETVNTNCQKNIRGEARGVNRLQGTGRHFFSDQPRPSVRSNSPATKECEVNLKDVARIVRQKEIPLHRIFVQADQNRSGILKIAELANILSSVLELSKSQAADLSAKFDKKKKGSVKYDKVVRAICEETIKDNMKVVLDSFRRADEEVTGLVSHDVFLKVLTENGVLIEDASVLSVETEELGDVNYLSYINSIAKKRR